LAVVRVTSSGVENHVLKLKDPEPGRGPGLYTPRANRIYANYPALGGLCVWAGDHFEPAALDGRQGVDGIVALTAKAFENENGWSKRGVGVTRTDSNFTITVGDKFELAVNNLAVRRTARGAISAAGRQDFLI
jgi:hypothetical protein